MTERTVTKRHITEPNVTETITASLTILDKRLFFFLEQMAQIGATSKGGCNRQALTELDAKGRALFLEWCRVIGGAPRLDTMGNLFVRFAGQNPTRLPVLIGSHLDTQPTGGKYDGVYGVLAALEVMNTLYDSDIQLSRPVEIVVWCNEEGARFSPAMMGSGVFAGVFEQADIYKVCDREGLSFRQALCETGQLGKSPCRAFPFHAALELHIEQGPILEAENKPVGVVCGVQGMNWYYITLLGQSVHAGPTPMSMRCDPVQALSRLLTNLYQAISVYGDEARITVGKIQTTPSSPNTVPERIELTVDIRHPDQARLDAMSQQVLHLCHEPIDGVEVKIEPIWESPAVRFAPQCIQAVEQACEFLSLEALPIVSGAGHDSVYLSRVGPTGMIFVPCKDGISHNEAEYVAPEYLSAGANVLLHSLIALTNQSGD
jgi:N-carbamoyl-L-amino-acid hydrolase